jgi:peptidoglycan/xylan/chitin deacetylase (PgdA/CDA1 family)
VLGFHRVLSAEEYANSDSLPGMIMSEATFAALLAYLQDHFQVIRLDELEWADRKPSKPCCLLTFDDGWRDNYARAYPLLASYKLPATVFLATGFIGTDADFWVEQLVRASKTGVARILSSAAELTGGRAASSSLEALIEWLKRMPAHSRAEMLDPLLAGHRNKDEANAKQQMLNWDQVVEMSRGGIEFGAHTVNHPLLPYEEEVVVEQELREAKKMLEKKLGKEIVAFAYPNGDWNPAVRRSVQEAGYQYAFTTRLAWHRRGSDPYTIPRILLHEGSVTGRDGRFSPAMFNLLLARSA